MKNLIRDDDGKPLSLSKNTVNEAWSSKTYQKIRNEFLTSKRPEMCERCFREEDAGVQSARQRWNQRWLDQASEKLDIDNPQIKYVDLRLGNLCNLKCRMCNPFSSNKWVDEWNQVVGPSSLVPVQALTEEDASRLRKMDWPNDEKTWENLDPILSSVEEIYLTGGEPFLSLKQAELLQKLVNRGRAHRVVIKYNTNGTVYPEKIIPLWKHFQKVRLNVSIDGVGELNEYIRYPASWKDVEANLEKFFALKKQGWPIDIGVHTTVQVYNILQLKPLIHYFESKYDQIPYFNILNHPACLNIRSLPRSLKSRVLNDLKSLQNIKSVQEVLSYMLAEDWSDKYWGEFLDYTKKLDCIRDQKWIISENDLQLEV